MIHAAVVGLGVGEQHARALAADPRARIAWLYDLDAARAQRLAGELGQAKVARDFDQILADRGVDMIALASYDDAHATQVVDSFADREARVLREAAVLSYDRERLRCDRRRARKARITSRAI